MTVATNLTGVGNGSGEWRTPPELFERWNRWGHFDFDAAASHENALCRQYATGSGIFRHHDPTEMYSLTPRHASEEERAAVPTFTRLADGDGLSTPWEGRRVFLNPPYGDVEPWVRKCAEERDSAAFIFALLPPSTEAAWWHRWVKPYAWVTFPPGRIAFIHPDFPCKPPCERPQCIADAEEIPQRPMPKGTYLGCKHECHHALGEPAPSPASGNALVIYRPSWLD